MQISSAPPAFLCSLPAISPENVATLTRHRIFPHHILLSIYIRHIVIALPGTGGPSDPSLCRTRACFTVNYGTAAQAPTDEHSRNRACTVSEGRRNSAHIYLSVKVKDSFEIGLAVPVSEIAGKCGKQRAAAAAPSEETRPINTDYVSALPVLIRTAPGCNCSPAAQVASLLHI